MGTDYVPSTSCVSINSVNLHSLKEVYFGSVFILQVRTLRPRDIQWLVQEHTARKQWMKWQVVKDKHFMEQDTERPRGRIWKRCVLREGIMNKSHQLWVSVSLSVMWKQQCLPFLHCRIPGRMNGWMHRKVPETNLFWNATYYSIGNFSKIKHSKMSASEHASSATKYEM